MISGRLLIYLIAFLIGLYVLSTLHYASYLHNRFSFDRDDLKINNKKDFIDSSISDPITSAATATTTVINSNVDATISSSLSSSRTASDAFKDQEKINNNFIRSVKEDNDNHQEKQAIQNLDSLCTPTVVEKYPMFPSNGGFDRCSITKFPTDFNGKCEFDFYKDRSYLPTRRYLECIRAHKRVEWDKDVKEMQERAFALQNPTNCSNPTYEGKSKRWHLVRYTSHGHGADLFIMIWSIGNHWDRGIPVMITTSTYRFSDIKCGRGWSCHLSPPSIKSNCFLDNPGLDLSKVVNYYEKSAAKAVTMDKWCKPNGKFVPLMGRCICDKGFYPANNYESNGCLPSNHPFFKDERKWIPRKKDYDSDKQGYLSSLTHHWINSAPGEVYPAANSMRGDPSSRRLPETEEEKREIKDDNIIYTPSLKLKYGWFWWWSQIDWILHKDAPMREETINRIQKETNLDWNKPCIGLHIRRGDACNDVTAKHRKCPPFSVYLDAIKDISQRYGPITQVYLATDDAKAIKEAETEGAGFTWHYLKFDRSKYVGQDIDGNEIINDAATLNELYVDILATAHCDAVVGSMSSSVMWIVYGIMIGEKGFYPPFVSVDLVSFSSVHSISLLFPLLTSNIILIDIYL